MFSWSAHGARNAILFEAIRFFRLRGTGEKAARGFAIGLACTFYPTFGLGGIFGGFLARLCGGSIVAGFAGGTSLAFVWPLVFYLNIRTGALFDVAETARPSPQGDFEQLLNALPLAGECAKSKKRRKPKLLILPNSTDGKICQFGLAA